MKTLAKHADVQTRFRKISLQIGFHVNQICELDIVSSVLSLPNLPLPIERKREREERCFLNREDIQTKVKVISVIIESSRELGYILKNEKC